MKRRLVKRVISSFKSEWIFIKAILATWEIITSNERETYQLIMLVGALFTGILVGADDGMMAALTHIYVEKGEYGFLYHTLSENIVYSVSWGGVFSLIVAITYWLNYEELDEASLIGAKVGVVWSIGYGLSAIITYGIINGVLIGAMSVFCLILLTIIIDVSVKMTIGKRQQRHSSIKIG